MKMMRMRLNVFILVFAMIIAGCDQEKDKDTRIVFRYNESKGISSLDPAFARNEILIRPVSQLFCGLVEFDDLLNVRPLVAKRWSVSSNGLVYRFVLRNDVYFHDHPLFPNRIGRKVTAADFKYSFLRVVDARTASPGAWVFANVAFSDTSQGVKVVNDTVLQICLKQPFPAFLGLLTNAFCYVVPKEIVEYYGADFRSHPVGCGPFMFKAWREGEKLVLAKNPRYFEQDSKGRRLPYLDGVAISFIKDKQSEFLEFVKGNIDYIEGIHPAYSNELLTRNGKLSPKYSNKFQMNICPYLNTEYLGCLVDKDLVPGSPLVDKRIRQAINYGFNREEMIRNLRNNLVTPALWGIVPKGMAGFTDTVEAYTYNPDKARRLLKEAGYPEGKGLSEITLTTGSDYLDLCEFIQNNLAQIGVKIKIEISTGATFRESLANYKVPFFRNSWIADYPDAENYFSLFYSKNCSPNGANYTHFTSNKFDSLYLLAVSMTDQQRRMKLYSQMSALLQDEAPVVPLYYGSAIRFYSKNINGLDGNPINMLKLKRVTKR
jgi:peptide/nickel transport system substrate-binding protein